MTTVRCFVFVEFGANECGESGLPYSLEPRKWMKVLTVGTDPAIMGLPFDIQAVGFSEWRTSLNFDLNLDADRIGEELARIRTLIPGAVRVSIFTPSAETPPMRRLKPAVVIPFQKRAAA